MRVLWCGDAVASTGFARCSHAVCDALHSAGHEVHLLGINYFGDPHSHSYPVYPCVQPTDGGHDRFGVCRLPRLAKRLNPDVIVILQDPWNIPGYIDALNQYEVTTPVVGWLAVDAKNQKSTDLKGLSSVVVWCDFAKTELRRAGYEGPLSIIPLGVDHSKFYPVDQAESRALVCPDSLPSGAFIVGAVGRNQPRKRLDLTIQYFAEWIHSGLPGTDNTYLYLHVAPTGETGFDIVSLAKYYGIESRTALLQPPAGVGYTDDHMRAVYNSFDVYLSTSQGEGWGLPSLESMACGIPCVLPKWAAYEDWASAAMLVECSSNAVNAPLNSMAYTLGGIPDCDGVVNVLSELRNRDSLRTRLSHEGLTLAKSFSWRRTGELFTSHLEQFVSTLVKAA